MKTETWDPSRIRMLREAKGLTAEELARDLGVSRQVVYAWETGRRHPTLANLERLAGALGSFPSYFWRRGDNGPESEEAGEL